MNKIEIKTDSLNEKGLTTWNTALSHIGEYLPYHPDGEIITQAEIHNGPDGIKLFIWSSRDQEYFDF